MLWVLMELGSAASLWAADMRSTMHNLTRKGSEAEAEEICVFCHTPQLPRLLDSVAAVPLWQTSLPKNFSFVMYDDIGRSQFGDKPAVGSQSIACLSCHDATQAMGITNNATGDHPFGIPYRGFFRGAGSQSSAGPKTGDNSDAPFRAAVHLKGLDDFRLPSHGVVDNRQVWWVSASGVSPRRARNDLPLYIRKEDVGGGLLGNKVEIQEIPYVECSSCHDPHGTNKLFLRVSNEGSRLCLTCHDK